MSLLVCDSEPDPKKSSAVGGRRRGKHFAFQINNCCSVSMPIPVELDISILEAKKGKKQV